MKIEEQTPPVPQHTKDTVTECARIMRTLCKPFTLINSLEIPSAIRSPKPIPLEKESRTNIQKQQIP